MENRSLTKTYSTCPPCQTILKKSEIAVTIHFAITKAHKFFHIKSLPLWEVARKFKWRALATIMEVQVKMFLKSGPLTSKMMILASMLSVMQSECLQTDFSAQAWTSPHHPNKKRQVPRTNSRYNKINSETSGLLITIIRSQQLIPNKNRRKQLEVSKGGIWKVNQVSHYSVTTCQPSRTRKLKS